MTSEPSASISHEFKRAIDFYGWNSNDIQIRTSGPQAKANLRGILQIEPLKLVLILIFILYAISEADTEHVRTGDNNIVHFTDTVMKNLSTAL